MNSGTSMNKGGITKVGRHRTITQMLEIGGGAMGGEGSGNITVAEPSRRGEMIPETLPREKKGKGRDGPRFCQIGHELPTSKRECK